MKSHQTSLDYLSDILQAIEKTEVFITGYNFERFKQDDKTVFAVIRALEILGEASRKITEDIRITYSEVPWREMAGIRDKLIHDYFGVDLEVVWKTATEDLPVLKPIVKRIIDDLSNP